MKSDQMREDELNRAVAEDAESVNFIYSNWHNYDRAAAENLGKMTAKHKMRQLQANEMIHRQKVKDELGIIGLAGCVAIIVIPLLCWLVYWLVYVSMTCCQ